MTVRTGWVLAVVLAMALSPATARALAGQPSPLTLAVMEGIHPPRLVLAQRAIDRAWGPSDDSTYVEIPLGDWKSEGLAAALSAAVPGAGQLYAGEASGYVFLLMEAAGWVSQTVFHRRAGDQRDEMLRYAGSPTDSTSGWSAVRWQEATGGDPSTMVALYQADRDAYLRLLATNDIYLAGWSGDAGASRTTFAGIRDNEQQSVRNRRYATVAILFNHVAGAVEALRAVRAHNMPLRRDLELRLRSGWRAGHPSVMLALRRTF